MKCFFRLLGGCLVFCGAIWIISCVYAAVFLASPLYALFAVPGAGSIWLGVWLCRRFWVKFERNREQKRQAREEQKRKALEEQRLQEQRDAKERRRQKLLADAGLLEPERREWISRLERASAAFSSRMLYGVRPNYARDTEVDEVSWDWDCFAVSAAADLNEILDIWLDIRAAAELSSELPWHFLDYYYRGGRPVFILDDAAQPDRSACGKEALLRRCQECGALLMLDLGSGYYKNLLTDEFYKLAVGVTWPGSADDAATYGKLCWEKTESLPSVAIREDAE